MERVQEKCAGGECMPKYGTLQQNNLEYEDKM